MKTIPSIGLSIANGVAALSMALMVSGQAEPHKGEGNWTIYYIKEADSEFKGKSGGNVTIITREGEKLRFQVSPDSLRGARIEGTAGGKDPESGKYIVSNIVSSGVFEDLPEGWDGKGNRANPIHNHLTVAADPAKHPFGSRLYVDYLVGWTPPGWDRPHDGYLWVADVGGGIKGWLRFDYFVGREINFEKIMEVETDRKTWDIPLEIEHMPSLPDAYNLRTFAGVHKILHGIGMLENEEVEEEEVLDAVVEFQKKHFHIPEAEHRDTRGAITQWYLTQAALCVQNEKDYDPDAASKRPESEKDEEPVEEKKEDKGSGESEKAEAK